MIGTPSYDGTNIVSYTVALTNTIKLGLQNGIEFFPFFLSHEPIISRARNIILHNFITADMDLDGLLWIDADVEWEPQWAIDVINSNKDVIGIPLCVKDINKEHYSLALDFDDLEPDENGLLSVFTMGTGFLYNSKEALQKIYDKALPFMESGREMKWVFENQYTPELLLGEDVILCAKLRHEGYKVYIDTTKSLKHIGKVSFYGDFATYLKRVQEEKKTKKEEEKSE